MNDISNIVVYNDGELELKVSVDGQNVWLNRNQISELFGRDVKTIGKHINNVFKEKELDKNMVVANFATTTHLGASLKDLGKKWFAFSKMNFIANELIEKIV